MKKTLLASVAALFLVTGTAHSREWQGNMPNPVGKLPSYPPVVCVTTNWTPEPCKNRQPSVDMFEGMSKAIEFFKWLEWTRACTHKSTTLIDVRLSPTSGAQADNS